MVTPVHFWVFHNGSPQDPPATFLQSGHINFDTDNVIANGNVVIKALDNSWLVHVTFDNFTFVNDTFNGDIVFSTITGTPPSAFTGSMPVGPVPLGVLIPSQAANTSFIFGVPPATP